MSITPNVTRQINKPICSKCGNYIYLNNQAIVHEGMHDGEPLVIGDCCADKVIGALIQDFCDALTVHSVAVPSHWLTSTPERAERIILALRKIAEAYEDKIDPYARSIRNIKRMEGKNHD